MLDRLTSPRAQGSLPALGIKTQPEIKKLAPILLMAAKLFAEELRRSAIAFDPAFPEKEIMDFVRKNQLFKLHILFAQSLGQISGLLEWDVAIIVAMDQEHGRFPLIDGGNGRRIEGQLDSLFVIRS